MMQAIQRAKHCIKQFENKYISEKKNRDHLKILKFRG